MRKDGVELNDMVLALYVDIMLHYLRCTFVVLCMNAIRIMDGLEFAFSDRCFRMLSL